MGLANRFSFPRAAEDLDTELKREISISEPPLLRAGSLGAFRAENSQRKC